MPLGMESLLRTISNPQPDPVGELPIRLRAVSDARIERRMMWRAGCSGARSEFVYLAVLLESCSHGHRLGPGIHANTHTLYLTLLSFTLLLWLQIYANLTEERQFLA